MNVKLDTAGLAKLSDVNPIWNAGLGQPRAKTCTCSGRWVCASTAIVIRPISDWLVRGAIASRYASRPATVVVPGTVTRVVGPTSCEQPVGGLHAASAGTPEV